MFRVYNDNAKVMMDQIISKMFLKYSNNLKVSSMIKMIPNDCMLPFMCAYRKKPNQDSKTDSKTATKTYFEKPILVLLPNCTDNGQKKKYVLVYFIKC